MQNCLFIEVYTTVPISLRSQQALIIDCQCKSAVAQIGCKAAFSDDKRHLAHCFSDNRLTAIVCLRNYLAFPKSVQ